MCEYKLPSRVALWPAVALDWPLTFSHLATCTTMSAGDGAGGRRGLLASLMGTLRRSAARPEPPKPQPEDLGLKTLRHVRTVSRVYSCIIAMQCSPQHTYGMSSQHPFSRHIPLMWVWEEFERLSSLLQTPPNPCPPQGLPSVERTLHIYVIDLACVLHSITI